MFPHSHAFQFPLCFYLFHPPTSFYSEKLIGFTSENCSTKGWACLGEERWWSPCLEIAHRNGQHLASILSLRRTEHWRGRWPRSQGRAIEITSEAAVNSPRQRQRTRELMPNSNPFMNTRNPRKRVVLSERELKKNCFKYPSIPFPHQWRVGI